MQEVLKLYSSIDSNLMRKTLFKGFFFAFLGFFLILYTGIFFNRETLSTWGFTIFITGMGLMAWGLLPYRQLSRLASKPDEIILVGTDHMEFYSKGKMLFRIPFQMIKKLSYIEQGKLYGIGLSLKSDSVETMICQFPKNLSHLVKQTKQKFGTDFFFPYFSQRSFKEMQEWQKMIEQDL
jgi:hypothetical protein